MKHKSVLLSESIFVINPRDGGIYVDMTLGAGGHTRKLLEKSSPSGIVIAFDRDKNAIEYAKETFQKEFRDRLLLVNDNFSNCLDRVKELGFESVNGVIMDLGVSLDQLKSKTRGFSFMEDAPLDMRMDMSKPLTAEKIVNEWREKDIENILRVYGEERFAGRIARNIIKNRPIYSTRKLAEIVETCLPRNLYKRIHPATRTFQALRIVVNDELESLKKGLTSSIELLVNGGVLCVISFHSLEDRIVKNTFRDYKNEGVVRLINKKPIVPTKEEICRNKKARSAKMRCLVKINEKMEDGND